MTINLNKVGGELTIVCPDKLINLVIGSDEHDNDITIYEEIEDNTLLMLT